MNSNKNLVSLIFDSSKASAEDVLKIKEVINDPL